MIEIRLAAPPIPATPRGGCLHRSDWLQAVTMPIYLALKTFRRRARREMQLRRTTV